MMESQTPSELVDFDSIGTWQSAQVTIEGTASLYLPLHPEAKLQDFGLETRKLLLALAGAKPGGLAPASIKLGLRVTNALRAWHGGAYLKIMGQHQIMRVPDDSRIRNRGKVSQLRSLVQVDPGWTTTILFLWSEEILSAADIFRALTIAGTHPGIGWNRPEVGGQFGTFILKGN